METKSEEYRREQMNIFVITMEIKSTADTRVIQPQQRPSLSVLEQDVEVQDFFCIFGEVAKELNDQAKKQSQQKVLKGKIKQKVIQEYLNTIKPTLSNKY